MKVDKHILHIGQMLLGVALALIVLTQSVYAVYPAADVIEQQESDEQTSDESMVVQSKAIPNSSSQINLETESFLLEELNYDDESDDELNAGEFLIENVRKAVKILFRKIIAPNAP